MSFNVNNTAIKRIQADLREVQKDPSPHYTAAPLEENLFDWHFTIRGPPGTEFEGGIYHGRILLPSDYPFKPPNIMLLTPNGRFEVRKKICLSISAFHPESWQPAWGLRLILEALISFFPTPGEGAIGALDWTPEERRRLAAESMTWECHKCGAVRDALPEVEASELAERVVASRYADEIAKMHVVGANAKTLVRTQSTMGDDEEAEGGEAGASASPAAAPAPGPIPEEEPVVAAPELAPAAAAAEPDVIVPPVPVPPVPVPPVPVPAEEPVAATRDNNLLYFAIALVVAIVALVSRKLLKRYGVL